MRNSRGFTLVELMMVLAILGTLAALAYPAIKLEVQREREQALRRALVQIRDAIDDYKRAAEQGRVRLELGDSGYPKRLTELVTGIPDQRSPVGQRMYFLRRLPRDPFWPDETTPAEQTWGLRSYESAPDAPREGRDIFDVYSTSAQTGLSGVPYRSW